MNSSLQEGGDVWRKVQVAPRVFSCHRLWFFTGAVGRILRGGGASTLAVAACETEVNADTYLYP